MNIKNILESGEVLRFHASVGIEKQKCSEHQWGVALILQHIYPECSKELLLAALLHDAAEVFTGDVPASAKWRYPELNTVLKEIELEFEKFNGIEFNLEKEDHFAMKLADTLEGMSQCLHQMRMGNRYALRLFSRWEKHYSDRYFDEALALGFEEANAMYNGMIAEVMNYEGQ